MLNCVVVTKTRFDDNGNCHYWVKCAEEYHNEFKEKLCQNEKKIFKLVLLVFRKNLTFFFVSKNIFERNIKREVQGNNLKITKKLKNDNFYTKHIYK